MATRQDACYETDKLELELALILGQGQKGAESVFPKLNQDLHVQFVLLHQPLALVQAITDLHG